MTRKQPTLVNLGPREFACGLAYTAASRVTRFDLLVFEPFPAYSRISNIFRHKVFKQRTAEDKRLKSIEEETLAELVGAVQLNVQDEQQAVEQDESVETMEQDQNK